MESDFYEFTAIRGIQAGSAYYVLMCPLKLVARLFRFNESEIPADLRAQRVLNRARVPAIARYITEHPKEYILSSLCASVDGEIDFIPASSEGPLRSVGRLRVSMTSTILINDGQHRRAAIEEAVRERPLLGDETISVVVFVDRGLERSQQMFADLNLHAVRPTRSIGVLYDHRDPLAALVRQVIAEIPLFRDFTDLERTSIPNRSLKLFTLSGLHQATEALLGKGTNSQITDVDRELTIRFWHSVASAMADWRAAAARNVSSAELRRDYVHAHGVALQAIGVAGARLIALYPKDWEKRLAGLGGVDWSRANRDLWEGRALVHGHINKGRTNVLLSANVILKELGVPLDPDGEALERLHMARPAAALAHV